MTTTQDAIGQAPVEVAHQLVERYGAAFVGPTRQLGPATPQDDLADLLPSEDALGVATETGDGAVVIVMMTASLATEIAGAPDASALASAVQAAFDQIATDHGLAARPVRAIVGAAQLSECIGDRPIVMTAGLFTGDNIDATVSVATFAPSAGYPTAAPSNEPASEPSAAQPTATPLTSHAPVTPSAAVASGSAPLDSGVLRRGLQLLADVHLDVTAQLGHAELTVSQLLDLAPGAVIELDKLAGAPLDLYVNGSLFARADVIVVEDTYAVQITEIVGDGTAP